MITPYCFGLLILLISTQSLSAHFGDRVYYTFQPETDSTVALLVNLHEHDLDGLLSKAKACEPSRERMICASVYFTQHLSATINSVLYPIEPIGSSVAKQDVVFRFRIRVAPSQIKTFTLKNTCFVMSTPKLENIVAFKFADEVLYSMTSDRTSVSHTFQARP